MKLLIVDDEIFTVRAIQTTIDWAKTGVDQTFSAYNAAKAREILMNETIDLMICDIEMPREDGLSLVEWLRQKGMDTEVIFLTCHSEFDYARRALQLKVFDYVVKPVNFEEMEKTISKAVERILAARADRTKTKVGEYWLENKREAEALFWHWVLAKSGRSPETMEERAGKQEIDFNKDSTWILILISTKKIRTRMEKWNDELLIFSLSNLAREIVLEDLYSCRVVEDGDRFVLICEGGDEKDWILKIQKFLEVCRKYVGTSVFCYVSNPLFCEELYDGLCRLQRIEKNDVAGAEEIMLERDCDPGLDGGKITVPAQWQDILNYGNVDGFLKEFGIFMKKLEFNHMLNYQRLKDIQNELMRMFIVAMEKNHIRNPEVSWVSGVNAVETVEALKRWVEKGLAPFLKTGFKCDTSNQAVVERIKSYVCTHLSEPLGRDILSETVNLSPDYVSRVFKNETGENLSQFIANQRMEKAVFLMETTDFNISRIAQEVGCDNFSYFSKLFKKYTGVSPRVWRNGKMQK